MSCENVQELISEFLDGRLPEAERGSVLAHTDVCRQCGAHLEAFQTQRAAMRSMAQRPVPAALAAKLQVIASHERERQLGRVTLGERVRRMFGRLELLFDNLLRPVALPFTGGLLSTLLIFAVLMPKLSFSYPRGGHELSTVPSGRIVTNPYDVVADADDDFPRIEPINSSASDFIDVVDLTIDETGKVVDWNVVHGELTSDMKSVILFSRFQAATNLGIATSGKIRIVQGAPSLTVRG